MIPTPRTFESILLQIRISDWLIHLPIPIDLENIQSLDEAEDEEVKLAIAAITHPWKFVSEIQAEESKVEDCLSRLLRCRIISGEWFVVKRGLFTDCRVRLSRNATGCLTLETMSW